MGGIITGRVGVLAVPVVQQLEAFGVFFWGLVCVRDLAAAMHWLAIPFWLLLAHTCLHPVAVSHAVSVRGCCCDCTCHTSQHFAYTRARNAATQSCQ